MVSLVLREDSAWLTAVLVAHFLPDLVLIPASLALCAVCKQNHQQTNNPKPVEPFPTSIRDEDFSSEAECPETFKNSFLLTNLPRGQLRDPSYLL